ncbi:MAG: hypothetical protein ACOC0N_09290 [Chroococcales cyanobacterium]
MANGDRNVNFVNLSLEVWRKVMVKKNSQSENRLRNFPSEQQPFSKPIGSISIPAGYTASTFGSEHPATERSQLSKMAAEVLQDPLLLRQLCDRIYELMQDDLRQQQERSRHYGKLL